MSKFNVNIVNIYAKSVEFSSRTSILVTRQASPFSGWSFGSIWWVHWLRCMFFLGMFTNFFLCRKHLGTQFTIYLIRNDMVTESGL